MRNLAFISYAISPVTRNVIANMKMLQPCLLPLELNLALDLQRSLISEQTPISSRFPRTIWSWFGLCRLPYACNRGAEDL
jgi:hypothetical protein